MLTANRSGVVAEMTKEDYEELIRMLDGRIDRLTNPLPSRQILRFAEAIRSAQPGDRDSPGTYSEEDYGNLIEAQRIVEDLLPPLLESIRARSIDDVAGWRFTKVDAGYGDYGLCGICRDPFQHFGWTVEVHHVDMHPTAFRGVCRDCVRQYAPIEFIEQDGVEDWLKENQSVCKRVETDHKTEEQRVSLIDAIRRHALSTHYFGEIVSVAPKWAEGAFGEWR